MTPPSRPTAPDARPPELILGLDERPAPLPGMLAALQHLLASILPIDELHNTKSITVNYKYDAMNRVTSVSGAVHTTYGTPLPVTTQGKTNFSVTSLEESYEDISDDVITQWKEFENKAI